MISNLLTMPPVKGFFSLIKETYEVAKELLVIIIPVMVAVKLLKEFGYVGYLGEILSPLMAPLGLPGEMGLVWSAAILTNIYAGIATLVSLPMAEPLSVAQATVLGTVILIAHGLPTEILLCRKVGGVWKSLLIVRLLGAMALGVILNLTFSGLGVLTEPSQVIWTEQAAENSLWDWVLNQFWSIVTMLTVLFCLLSFMRILKLTGLFDLACKLVSPFLSLSGISKKASPIASIGILAGITFGSGLLIAEAKKNEVGKPDVFLTLIFLSLCHGLIEDTSLMLLIGSSLWGILAARILFALVVTAGFSYWLRRQESIDSEESKPVVDTDLVKFLDKRKKAA